MSFATIWEDEPAMVTAVIAGVVDAGLVLATTFGLPVTPDQKVAIDGFISAALALAGLLTAGAVTRSQVVPHTAAAIMAAPPVVIAPSAPPAPTPVAVDGTVGTGGKPENRFQPAHNPAPGPPTHPLPKETPF